MARARNEHPVDLASLLGGALARLDPAGKLRLLQRWRTAVGETVAARSEPDRLDDGLLVVRVGNHSWCQELQLLKPQILARLADEAGGPPIRDVYFAVGQISLAPPTPEPNRTAAPTAPTTATGDDERGLDDLFADLQRMHAERGRSGK